MARNSLPKPILTADRDAQRTLRVYGLYRIVLAALILLVFLAQFFSPIENAYWPELFLGATLSYFVLTVVTHFYAGFLQFRVPALILFNGFFFADIIALTLASHASGGLSLGLSLIMTLTVASSGIFFRDLRALLLAALSSMAIVLNVSLLIRLNILDSSSLFAAGMQGLVFFATAAFTQWLSSRIESSQALADEKARQLARSEQLNKLIVRRMQTGVLVLDHDLGIQSANEAALQLLELAEDEPLPALTLPAPLLKSLSNWERQPMLRTAPFKIRESSVLLQTEFMPLSDEEGAKLLIFVEDSSRMRQQAQQIKLASLGRLTASIAHEIRNPLSAISHAAQLLEESPSLASEDKALCDIVTKQSLRLNRIVENVTQLSRREPAKVQRFELVSWLNDFIRSNDLAFETNGITLSGDSSCNISFDDGHLDQVLNNLCSNGLRHSLAHSGESCLQLQVSRQGDAGLPQLDIIDQGAGIRSDIVDQLFEPFFTEDSGGTGLGLFIARELCEANQSRLDYVREHKDGTCFRISFAHPLKKIDSGAIQT